MNRLKMRFAVGAALVLAVLLPPGATGQVRTFDELKYPPLPEFKVPKPTRVELPNGMVVILLEDHEMPLVDASARVHTGSRLEPADRVGLASLTGTVLRTGGTTSMPSDKLDEYLEGKAAYIETGIGEQYGTASMGCLKEDFREVLEVFADVLRNPAFEEDKIKVAKTQITAGIARQNDDPNQIMYREFGEIIYGEDSPYARSETYDTINAITRADLVAWHQKYYHPNRIILGLSGDFDADEAVALVKEAFGDWKKGPAPGKVEAAYKKTTEPGVFYVEKNDMTQSNIMMGHLGILKSNPDYYAVEIVNHVLSGSFASRLFANVRSKKALAYRVSGGVRSNFDYPGTFNMLMTTKTETTAAGIDALFEEARNLTAKPPTEEEVSKAKSSILNSFVFNSDSTRKILDQQLTYEYFGYPLDWLERYRNGIDKATLAEVRQAAAKYVDPDRFAILVVGPSEGQDRPLEEFGRVANVDITIPEPTVQAMVASAEEMARGKALIAKAVETMGGADRIDSVRTLEQSGAMVLKMPQGEMEVKSKATFAYPDRVRQELVTPMGNMTMVSTPDGAFMQNPQGVQPMPDSMRKEFDKNARRELVALMKARMDPEFMAAVSGDGEADGTPVELVVVQFGGMSTTLGIDPATGRVLSMAYKGTFGMQNSPGDVLHTFSDFRKVDGILYPHLYKVSYNGEPAGTFTCESLTLNAQLDESAFAMAEAGMPGKGSR